MTTIESAACTLRLLGQPRLLRPNQAPHLLERRDAALLAALALDGPMSRERAIAWLWPGADRKSGQNNLRQRLFRLKQAAGRDLVTAAASLQLAPDIAHDLQPDAAEEAGASAIGAAAAAWATEAGATTLELMQSLDYSGTGELADWVDDARARWRAQRRLRLAERADAHEHAGEYSQALAVVALLLRDDPGHERPHRQCMRLHYLRGDRAAALAAWDDCVRELRRSAGAAPDDDTRALHRLIKAGAALPAAQSGSGLAAPARRREVPVALRRPPRCVGREAAWRELDAALAERQALLLSGEPGVGKSRLLGDFASRHGLLVIGARPGDDALPYALIERLLRAAMARGWQPAADEADAFAHWLIDAEQRIEPRRLERALAAAAVDWQRAGWPAVVIDDLQFADAASQELLLRIAAAAFDERAASASAAAARLWFGVRSGAWPPALQTWCDAAPPGPLRLIDLPPLDETGIAELLASLEGAGALAAGQDAAGQDAAGWRQRTGGNPLFILQSLLALWERGQGEGAAPADLARLLDDRLRQLSAPALRLARVAALAESDFSLPVAAQVLGVHAVDLSDPLLALERAHVVRDNGFAYDLVAEAARRSVPPAVAVELHAQLARVLRSRGAPAARVARHADAGQLWADAAAAWEQAGAEALAAARPVERLHCWDRAAACHARVGDASGVFRAARQAALAAAVVEAPGQVLARNEGLSALATNTGERIDAMVALVHHRLAGGDAAGAPMAAEALQLARQLGERQRIVEAACVSGVSTALAGDVSGGLAVLQSVGEVREDEVPAVVSASQRHSWFGALGYVLNLAGRNREALQRIEAAAHMAEALGDLHEAAVEHGNAATLHWQLGDALAAQRSIAASISLWRRLGNPPGFADAVREMNAAIYATALGRYGAAISGFERALAGVQGGPAMWIAVIENHLALLWLRLGQPARALQVLTPLGDEITEPMVRCKRADVLLRLRPMGATPLHERLRQAYAAEGARPAKASDRHHLDLRLAALSPPDEALALAGAVYTEAGEQHPGARKFALALMTDALRQLGRVDEAAAHARRLLADPSHAGEMAPAEVLWIASQSLQAAGADGEARPALNQAAHWLVDAQRDLPDAFIESFRERNPLHRSIRLAHARLRVRGEVGPA